MCVNAFVCIHKRFTAYLDIQLEIKSINKYKNACTHTNTHTHTFG